MQSQLRFIVASIAIITLLVAAPTVAAQQNELEPESTTEEVAFDYPVTPGTTDLTMSGGFSNWALYLEPGFDFGMVPISDDITLSLGVNVQLGYCVWCLLTRALPFTVSAWYINPMGRLGLHFNMLSEGLNMPQLNLYAGFAAGPSYYKLDFTTDVEASAHISQVTMALGPYGGARYVLSGNTGLFVFMEGRFLVEFGMARLTVDTGEEDVDELLEGSEGVSRAGLDMAMGLGIRF